MPRYLPFLAILALLSGCATPPMGDEVSRLIAYPGFEDAGRMAPRWTIEALDTVERLENELRTYRP
jgi:hypothetical protein